MLARIETIPLDLEARADLVASSVNSKILYDTAVSPLSKRELQRWRARICTAIWGRSNPSRCLELVFTLLCKGHATDPLQASVYRVISTVKRMLTRHPDMIPQWSTMLDRKLAHVEEIPATNVNVHGPVMRFIWAARKLGWHILDSTTMQTRDGSHVSLLEIDEGLLQHFVRDDLRDVLWEEAARRRPDLHGTQAGVDRESTLTFLKTLRANDKRMFMAFLVVSPDTPLR